MPLVLYQGATPQCIEGFPDDAERSCKGALHLRPHKATEVTDDEFAYIKTNRADVSKKLLKVRETAKKKPAPEEPK